MVDSQLDEIVDGDIHPSNLPSFNNGIIENNRNFNNQEYFTPESSLDLHSAEVVIPYENYVVMQMGGHHSPMETSMTSQTTQYTQLSIDLEAECKGKHRSAETRREALQCFKKGMKRLEIARHFKIHESTLRKWKKEWKIQKKIGPKTSTGRPRTLWEAPVKTILDTLDANPSATNEMLAAATFNMVTPQSISNYLKRENYTRKKIMDGGAQKMDDRIVAETKEYYDKVKNIPWEKRVYMDESFVYNNEAPSMGRSKAGEPINRVRDRRGRRWTIYLAIRVDGLVHPPILEEKNADDVEFMKYVENTLVPSLRPGEVVIWDRLGRSGRAKNPCKQHYNPRARQLIEEKGCQLFILPPKGKFFDPIELVFGLIKGEVRKTYGFSIAAYEQRPRNKQEILNAVMEASYKITGSHIRKFYKERADGRSFKKVYPDLIDKIF